LETASLSTESVVAAAMAPVAGAYGVGVTRKALDTMKAEGEALVRLMDAAGGVGRNMDTYA